MRRAQQQPCEPALTFRRDTQPFLGTARPLRRRTHTADLAARLRRSHLAA